MRINKIFPLALTLFLSGSASLHATDVKTRLDRLVSDSLLQNAFIGLDVIDITSGDTIYQLNADRFFTPASNLKLFTSAAALELLGPNFRFKTEFYYDGKIDKKGRLKGALIIMGGGDPLISGRFRSHITEILECWADSLKSRGINEIDGGIAIDNSYFEGPELGPGWSWDDLSYWYACPISALSFNDNCINLKFLPGKKAGDPAIINIDPITDYITVQNNAVTLPPDSSFTLDYYRIPHTNNITFFGGIAANDTSGRIDYVSVDKPEVYCATVFCDVLHFKGIKVKKDIRLLSDKGSKPILNNVYENATPLFNWQSDSLGEVIKVINTNSQNFFAEQTLRTVGAEKDKEGSFATGIKATGQFFESIGIDRSDLVMHDGSGLSYMNMVKPQAIMKLLKYMAKSPDFGVFYESLACPGKDKSLKNRLKDNPYRERVRAKTGYIANTSTFSGYLRGPKSDHLLAFSIMVNHYDCPESSVEAWQDSIVATMLEEY
jgi:D-alanyl-D-alanine carboxypeptidase/D-alanyl-D-alanine-endopeptidase (penicillin-binding protein 4)